MHRRRLLALAGTGIAGAVAGCGGSDTEANGQSIDDHPAATELDSQPRRGDLGGHVVLTFEDPSCPTCREFHRQTVPQIQSNIVDPGLGAYVVRTYPVIYPWGEPATQALEATYARDSEVFWSLLGHYFERQEMFTQETVLDRTATFLDENTALDGAAVASDARERAYDGAVQADISAAQAADLGQTTPVTLLFRNGTFVTKANGRVSYDLVSEALGVN